MDGQNVGNLNNSAPNLDDVLSVLEADETYQHQDSEMSPPGPSQPNLPFIKILEQPAPKALRFRYECEGRSAGSIPGINSTPENRTFPTIQISGYKGPRAVVLVSCVTKDFPHKAHPHKLVGRDICKKGVCTVTVNSENMIVQFSNLGIQCVKRRDIEEALNERNKLRVDPYRKGFAHANQPGSIDLNSLRLCFQAYVDLGGPQLEPLKPVVSDPIYDKKAMADLMICKLSQCSGSAAGGAEIILLCEKVAKEDIAVRFYEEIDGNTVWEGYGEFTPTQVHKQVAIAFKTPRYKTLNIDHPVSVWIELLRPSDKACSERRQFIIYPVESGTPNWSLRRGLGKSSLFNDIIETQKRVAKEAEERRRQKEKEEAEVEVVEVPQMEGIVLEDAGLEVVGLEDTGLEDTVLDESGLDGQGLESTRELEIVMEGPVESPGGASDSSLHELLEQVKDLEEMFPEEQAVVAPELYTSLQMAMKNPMQMSEYEDVPPPRPTAAKPSRPPPDEALPPLPPKRAKRSNLPSIPEKTKLNIFQKLFSKKKKSKSLSGSVGSKGSSKTINSAVLDDKDLTEAEHYALYTSFAPRATLSECDDVSFYYSQVDGQKAT